MGAFSGQTNLNVYELQSPSIGADINHAYGNSKKVLTRPTSATVLYLYAESGDFRIKLGDVTAGTAPGADVTDGSGSFLLKAGTFMHVSAPGKMTVIGSAGTAILTYWYV